MKITQFTRSGEKLVTDGDVGMERCSAKRIILQINDGKKIHLVEMSAEEVAMAHAYIQRNKEESKEDDKPTLKIDLSGPDGNAFVILAKVKRLIGNEKYAEYSEKAKSGDYDHLLEVTRQYVNLEEL